VEEQSSSPDVPLPVLFVPWTTSGTEEETRALGVWSMAQSGDMREMDRLRRIKVIWQADVLVSLAK